MFIGSIPAGIFKHVTVVNVGATVPDGYNRVCQNRTITVTVTAERDCVSCLSVSGISRPTIYIAGSTSGIAADPKNPHIRWEHMLTAYTNQKIAVSDHSYSGLTIESFRKEGHYAAINEYSRPGDFYFFQFDPLSQSMEDWTSCGNSRRQLTRYVIECRERMAYPVLLTPVAYCSKQKADDYFSQLWEQYLEACREISILTETPVIELHKLNVTSYDAYVIAGLVAHEITRICGKYPKRGYQFLAKCLQTTHC